VSPDQITLTLPGEEPFFAVAHLVLGGLAVRLDLGYEQLEDLQGALTLLLNRQVDSRDVTLVVRITDHELEATVGPLDGATERELQREAGPDVDLRRVLDTVVDSVEVTKRDGRPWVTLHMSIERSGVAT
jgi:hypothetical protein